MTAWIPNRNFPINWGRDNEGSSDDPFSETYRGTGPASEPETRGHAGGCGGTSTSSSRRTTTRRPSCCCIRSATSSTPGRRTRASSGAGRQRRRARRSPTRCLTRRPSEWRRDRQPVRPGPRRRALHHQRRHDEAAYPQRILGVHTRGLRARPGEGAARNVRLRVPGRRGGHRGGVPASPAVRARPGAARRRTPPIRCRTWATRRATSTSTRSATPTATRNGSRSTRRSRLARSASAGGSTTAPSRPVRRAASTRASVRDGARHLLRPPARSRARRAGR